MDEKEAIARMKAGDISGLETVVRTYQVQAVRAADMITRDIQRAQDIVQSVFVRVFQRIEQYDSSRPFKPWLMQIVVNDALKAVSRDRSISLETPIQATASDNGATLGDVLEDENPTPDAMIDLLEEKEAVWDALGKLSSEERAVIVMRYFLAFSEKEMADALDSPTGTVKWRLHKARKRLRELLAPLRQDESPRPTWSGKAAQ